jgi:hypothetical protein
MLQLFCESSFENFHQLHQKELKFSLPIATVIDAKLPARNEVYSA